LVSLESYNQAFCDRKSSFLIQTVQELGYNRKCTIPVACFGKNLFLQFWMKIACTGSDFFAHIPLIDKLSESSEIISKGVLVASQ
jgi:hypothetical protein